MTGKYFQLNSNLNVVKTSMQSFDLSRDALVNVFRDHVVCLDVDRKLQPCRDASSVDWDCSLWSIGQAFTENQLFTRASKTIVHASKRTIFHVSEQNDRSGAHRDISTQNQRRDLYGAHGSKLSTSLKTKWSDVTDVSPRT